MAQNKRKNMIQDAKNTSMLANQHTSMNSKTGYQDTGCDAQVHAKARAIRQSENGSHM